MHQNGNLQPSLGVEEEKLPRVPDAVPLLFQKGVALEKAGRVEEAGETYRELLQHDPEHRQALNELGNLLFARGNSTEARPFYELAVASHPRDPMSLVNLGNLLMKSNKLPAAGKLFERALQVNPDYRPAHAGMSFVLQDQGETEQAAVHRSVAFQDHCVVSAPYRGAQPPITILELIATIGGTVRTQEFLNDRVFKRFLVVTEFFNSNTVLPPHDLVFNSIGDSDSASVALAMAQSVINHTQAPVINHPAAVQATGRCLVAERFARVPNVITPKTMMMSREVLTSPDYGATLSGQGFTFPLLLRSPGFHGGEHFVKVEAAAGLALALADLPGDQLLVIQYLDARGCDGKARKYRVMMVDGKLYPLHVAISQSWKIHYFSAEMAENADHRAEDAAFLTDMTGVLGPRAMAALEQIQRTIGLDYGGVDFGLNASGEILLFEANATMAVIVPDKGEQWDYRRAAVETIYKAVWTMLINRAVPLVDREMRRHIHGTVLDCVLIAQSAPQYAEKEIVC
jgi:glutathione synthase/RimK-type ligase-like ATP-grasp enzyme